MKFKAIETKKIIEYILWIIAYLPILLLLIFKYPHKNMESIILDNGLCAYLIILISTIIFYKLAMFCVLRKLDKKMKKRNKILYIKNYNPISMNDYSFFILSILIPFVSFNTDNILDFLVVVTLILVIILVLVKKNQLVTNPVFLFSKMYVFEATVKIDGVYKDIYVLSENKSLISDDGFFYSDYFESLYYLKKNNY